jgi:hypothetical protein
MECLGQLLLNVHMGKIRFPEFFHKIRPVKGFEVFFLLAFERLKMVEAVVRNGTDQIGLRVLDLFMLGIQPLDKRLLHDIFRIRFAAKQPHGNCLKRGLIECDGLSLIQNDNFGKDKVFLPEIHVSPSPSSKL